MDNSALSRKTPVRRAAPETVVANGASPAVVARRLSQPRGHRIAAHWHARLLEAVRRLAGGSSVTAVALDLGYRNPGAFSTMFRRVLGDKPSAYMVVSQPSAYMVASS